MKIVQHKLRDRPTLYFGILSISIYKPVIIVEFIVPLLYRFPYKVRVPCIQSVCDMRGRTRTPHLRRPRVHSEKIGKERKRV